MNDRSMYFSMHFTSLLSRPLGYGALLTSHFRGKVCSEVSQAGELWAQRELRLVQQDREDGLGCAGIVDHLLGEENFAVVVSMLQGNPVVLL